MSTAVLTQTSTNWQENAAASIESFAHAVTPSSQAMLRLVSCYDSVTFDFSDWKPEELNENTTSFYWGISEGSLDISCFNLSKNKLMSDMRAATLSADSYDAESGKDIICIHDWCVHQARADNSYIPGQRYFRFERGRYASALPLQGLRLK
ncbi:hypothetical protein GGR57DRAFT_227939 [Xylariaceae sp. FL1272]|nr:hypothetical protein GGR57DRAFT_227939 [Xylariaceae sp. FL1272]